MMRLLFILVCSLPACAAYRAWVNPLLAHGPSTMIAGSRSIYSFVTTLEGDMTCDAGTNRCTASGWTPANATIGFASSTGTLPGGVEPMVYQILPTYALCDVSGQEFRLTQIPYGQAANCSTQTRVTITSAGTGTHSFSVSPLPGNIYLDPVVGSTAGGITGLPAGTTVRWQMGDTSRCPVSNAPWYDAGSNKYYAYPGYIGAYLWCAEIIPPPNATPGDYTLGVKFCPSTNSGDPGCYTHSWTVHLVAPPSMTPANPPASEFTQPTGMADFNAFLTATTSGLKEFCNPANPTAYTFPSCGESTICYYGQSVYHHAGVWLKDSAYDACALQVSSFYRDYLNANAGGVPGNRVFPRALMDVARLSGSYDGRYITALDHLIGRVGGVHNNPHYIRESGYALSVVVAQRKQYGTIHTSYSLLVDGVVSMLLEMTETSAAERHEGFAFQLGLIGDRLIEHWELTKDPRVPYVIKRIVDYLNNGSTYNTTYGNSSPNWNAGSALLTYSTAFAQGQFCSTSTSWYVPESTGCGFGASYYQRIHPLTVPLPWWLWRFFYDGSNTYRDWGDALFNSAFAARSGCSSKEAGEMTHQTFRALYWRLGR